MLPWNTFQLSFYLSALDIDLVSSSDDEFKGCVRYIFASLFCVSKREHFRNKEKYFLFHFKSSFHSWDNQVLIKFLDIQISWHHQMPKHETQNTLLNNLRSKCILVMKFGQFMQYYKMIFYTENLYEKYGLETSSRTFLFFKKSSVKKILWRSGCWYWQILIDLILHI